MELLLKVTGSTKRLWQQTCIRCKSNTATCKCKSVTYAVNYFNENAKTSGSVRFLFMNYKTQRSILIHSYNSCSFNYHLVATVYILPRCYNKLSFHYTCIMKTTPTFYLVNDCWNTSLSLSLLVALNNGTITA